MMGGVEVVQVDGPVVTGGLRGGDANPQISAPYDRHTLHVIRQAERDARRELRRQERAARRYY